MGKVMKKQVATPATKKVLKNTPQGAKTISSLILPPVEEAIAKVRKAALSGKWVIAAIRIDDTTMTIERVALNWPTSENQIAARLFIEDLERLKTS